MAGSGQTRQYKENFPPKPVMTEISDRLGLGTYYTSNGGTARTDFFIATAEALGIELPRDPYGEVSRTVHKQTIAEWAWRQVNDGPLSEKAFSRGSKVTNLALDGILEGMKRLGIDRRVPPATLTPDKDFDGASPDLTELVDSRKRVIREAYKREGQPGFRLAVMEAYDYTCCVTGTAVPSALEAAHIVEYRGKSFNHTTNGLALRGDIHTLHDRGLIAIHEDSLEILLKPEITNAMPYGDLAGATISIPADSNQHPDPRFLRAHRVGSGFREAGDTDV